MCALDRCSSMPTRHRYGCVSKEPSPAPRARPKSWFPYSVGAVREQTFTLCHSIVLPEDLRIRPGGGTGTQHKVLCSGGAGGSEHSLLCCVLARPRRQNTAQRAVFRHPRVSPALLGGPARLPCSTDVAFRIGPGSTEREREPKEREGRENIERRAIEDSAKRESTI